MVVRGLVAGGITGFLIGGPLGAIVGAVAVHAASTRQLGFGSFSHLGSARQDSAGGVFKDRNQILTFTVIVLSAKLARCDGPVKRVEIEAFKECFSIPPEAATSIGRLFDQARNTPDRYEGYADELGAALSGRKETLEQVLAALFTIARADGPVNASEWRFLRRVWQGFRLDERCWVRASNMSPSPQQAADPYAVLGVAPEAGNAAIRARWTQIMRSNHPDVLAAHGASKTIIAAASERTARVNAAWDVIKRSRGL